MTVGWMVLVGALAATTILVLTSFSGRVNAEAASKQWTDKELVESYSSLAGPALEAAILNPKRPHEAPNSAFLEALAWYADGRSKTEGTLSVAELDAFLETQVEVYREYLTAAVEHDKDNDYARTRTWKVIQKMSLLRDQMTAGSGTYDYGQFTLASVADDPWEREHTLASVEDFRAKVCRGSQDRPVLVKYGNTNCTQCLLFELTGSIKELADIEVNRGTIDVYKVWFGMTPDDTFDGRISNPVLLNDLAKQEGATSSPTFIVYRNGRRYPCGGAFPDRRGFDAHLQSCLTQAFDDAPAVNACGEMGS